MFNEEFTAVSKGAVAKATLLKKNPAGYRSKRKERTEKNA